jgi:TonB family protein
MGSLVYRDNYETSFKNLLKKTLILSILVHTLIFSSAYIKLKVIKKRQFYAPVYTVNLVAEPPLIKKEKKKSKSVTKKVPPKKKAPKKKEAEKIKPANSKKYAKEYHEKAKEIESEKALQDVIARIRGDVAEEDKLKETLKKLSKQVKEREKVDEVEEEVTKVEKKEKKVRETAARSQYGILSRDAMNLIEKKYYNIIWKKIKETWILPSDIIKKDGELVTIIVIRIEKDGKVSEIDVEESSKSDYYDQSAIRAIKKAEPFDEFIEGMDRDFFKVGIRFRSTEK